MEYIYINNEVLNFNKVYYVDGIEGSDTNKGLREKPLRTFTKAYNKCSDGDAIYLIGKKGVNYNDYTSAIQKEISIIGDGLLSVIDFSGENLWTNTSKSVDLYRVFIKTNQIFRGASLEAVFRFYNCLMKYDNVIGYRNNTTICEVRTYNCTYDSRGATFGTFRGRQYVKNAIAFGNLNNANTYLTSSIKSSYINDFFIEEGAPTNQGTSFSYEVDESYMIEGIDWQEKGLGFNPDGTKANLGVYGGPFSWTNSRIEYYFIESNNKKNIFNFESQEWEVVEEVSQENGMDKDDFERITFEAWSKLDDFTIIKKIEKEKGIKSSNHELTYDSDLEEGVLLKKVFKASDYPYGIKQIK